MNKPEPRGMPFGRRRLRWPLWSAALLAASGLTVLTPTAQGATGTGQPAFAFTGGRLPSAPGGDYSDLEPGIAASGDGTFIIGGNSGGRGADVWVSHDDGLHYRWAADPFQALPQGSVPVNGQDADVAAAPVGVGGAPPRLYATSLYVANSTLAASADGGKSFATNQVVGTPMQDRPWLAADGACTVYAAYSNVLAGPPSREFVSRFDACQSPPSLTGTGAVVFPVQSSTDPYPLGGFWAGKIAVDNSPRSRYHHNLYMPLGGFETNTAAQPTLSVAVSSDGGQTFAVHRVTDLTTGRLEIWPDQLAVDAAGRVYLAWSDDHQVFLKSSSDGGATWGPTTHVSAPPARSAILPSVAAGKDGLVDLAWYATDRDGAAGDQALMGQPGAKGAAQWRVWFAQSTDAGKHFAQVPVTTTVHTGIACTQAGACTVPYSRYLFEDLGIAISPTTGLASIAYNIDEFTIRPGGSHIWVGYATQLRASAMRGPASAPRKAARPPAAPVNDTANGGSLPTTGLPMGVAVLALLLVAAGASMARGRRS
ncbi:MAG TPA: hypothetical protein VM347_42720 [Nonomuraea sp.]|nr:hypothetical protein [Nonomuraea sp.]